MFLYEWGKALLIGAVVLAFIGIEAVLWNLIRIRWSLQMIVTEHCIFILTMILLVGIVTNQLPKTIIIWSAISTAVAVIAGIIAYFISK